MQLSFVPLAKESLYNLGSQTSSQMCWLQYQTQPRVEVERDCTRTFKWTSIAKTAMPNLH